MNRSLIDSYTDQANEAEIGLNYEAIMAAPDGSAIIQLRPANPEKETVVDDPSGIRHHCPTRNRELLQNQNHFDLWGQ